MIYDGNRISLSNDPYENLIEHKGKYYRIDFLKEYGRYVQGGNGIVFRLIDEQDEIDYVIKILKYPQQSKVNDKIRKRIQRFEREIEALYVAKGNTLQNVVQIEFNGEINISGSNFQYYVMEKCECTLKEYLNDPNKELSFFQKTILCQKILTGIRGLNEYKIYHRDIKHDNIFFIGNEPLIGDLGLADKKDSDTLINEGGDLIGPTGWFSPEAINKYLVESTPNPYGFDYDIDSKSEIFQLGKLFWYIYQGNIPIGQIEYEDFVPQDESIFKLLFNMLKYSKQNRFNSELVMNHLTNYIDEN